MIFVDVPNLTIPSNHCEHCPTAQGIKYGHDPEAYEILTNRAYFNSFHKDREFENIYCPWKKGNCVVYPVELKWARDCYELGIVPPAKSNPSFTAN